jgi:hypothetical protein
MAKDKNNVLGNTNVLPHNPIKAEHKPFGHMEIFNHVKDLKGEETGWYEFDLVTLLTRFPDDKMLKQAYADVVAAKKAAEKPAVDKKAAAAEAKAKKEKEAADKKAKAAEEKAKADAAKANKGTGKGKKAPPAPPAPAPDAKGKGKANGAGTSTKGRKTAAQLAAAEENKKHAPGPATEQSPEETAAELADIT